MSYERFIGTRYLMAKKSASLLSIITLISVLGVALGVTALIVVLSVMGGFKKDLKEKILGTKAHAVVRPVDGEVLREWENLVKITSEVPEVVGVSPYIESEVMISSPTNLSGVFLRGIDTERVASVSNLVTSIEEGKIEYLIDDSELDADLRKKRGEELDDLLKKVQNEREEAELEIEAAEEDRYGEEGFMPSIFDEEAESEEGEMPGIFDKPVASKLPGLIIGKELARSLQVSLGQEVNVVTPNGEMGPMGPMPRSRPFKIVGVFYSGMYEYDANMAYTALSDTQDFLDIDGVTGLEIKTVDVERADVIAQGVRSAVSDRARVLDWQELNRSLFYALKLEKIAMFVVLTFIILVASFSIVAMLVMIVIEKGREIAILKALGAPNVGIMRTFVFQGTVIGVVGAFAGLCLGLGICYFLSEFGFPLNSEVYYISTLPVDVDPVEIVSVVIAAILISFLATIYPSIQAAKLNPVEGLRNE